jgi:hypothetical protein
LFHSIPDLSDDDLKAIADLTPDQLDELAHQVAVAMSDDKSARSLDARLLPASFSSLIPVLKTVVKSFLPFKRDGIAELSKEDLSAISSLSEDQMDELIQELAKSLSQDSAPATRSIRLPTNFGSLVPVLKSMIKGLLPIKRSEYVSQHETHSSLSEFSLSIPGLSDDDLKQLGSLSDEQLDELAQELAASIADGKAERSLAARLLPASFSSLVPVLKNLVKSFLPFKRAECVL